MEQLFPVLVLGLGVIALLTVIRAVASLMRVVLIAVLALGIGYYVVRGKLPLTVKTLPHHTLKIAR